MITSRLAVSDLGHTIVGLIHFGTMISLVHTSIEIGNVRRAYDQCELIVGIGSRRVTESELEGSEGFVFLTFLTRLALF